MRSVVDSSVFYPIICFWLRSSLFGAFGALRFRFLQAIFTDEKISVDKAYFRWGQHRSAWASLGCSPEWCSLIAWRRKSASIARNAPFFGPTAVSGAGF